MPYRIQFRRGTAAQWTAANPVLADGEMGIETDTTKFKIGDGTTAWTSLAYGPVFGIPSDGSITESKIATGAVTQAKLASNLSAVTICTSSTRPASPYVGQMIFETDTNLMRVWLGSRWSGATRFESALPVEYLVIAGGAGAAANLGGGGGAGGYRTNVKDATSGGNTWAEQNINLPVGTYTVTVGAGGAGGAGGGSNPGNNGSDSVFGSISAIGGGKSTFNAAGTAGGSGGGAGHATTAAGGSGTPGQGFAGGAGGNNNSAAGGGGAGSAGQVGQVSNNGSTGGNGLSSSITGTAVTRAGGGGGAGATLGGAGGTGGGGAAGANTAAGTAGTANTGSGGGGGGNNNGAGGAGGSGVVIVRYLTADATGLTVTGGTTSTSGSYTIHTFNSSSSLVIA